MEMQVFRCRICGETFVGYQKPTNCPFCGAHELYMVLGRDWQDENRGVELTDVSRANLQKALEIELGNARFYLAASAQASDIEVQGMFKALSKIEGEHHSTIAKVLSVSKSEEVRTPGECHETDLENVEESHARETKASTFYAQAASEATEKRAKELFEALVEIEKDHLALDEMQKARLS